MKEVNEAIGMTELPAVVGALLEVLLNDKNESVEQSVTESIRQLSDEYPAVVIQAAVYFWELHRKMSSDQTISLLKIMTESLKDTEFLDDESASKVAKLALDELHGDMEEQASQLLVALSRAYCKQAMSDVIARFSLSEIPNHAIVKVAGLITVTNANDTIPYIRIFLNLLMPVMHRIHDQHLKIAISFTLGKFAEAINDYFINNEEPRNSDNEVDDLRESSQNLDVEITMMRNMLFTTLIDSWLRGSRDSQIIEGVLITISSLLPILPKNSNHNDTVKLIPILLNLCKKFANIRLSVTRVLAVILSSAIEADKENLRQYLENIHQVLFEYVCITPFTVNRDTLLTHYEVLKCFHAIVVLYPEEGLDRILSSLKSHSLTIRSRALMVLKHLINALPEENDTSMQRIALSLQDSLGESSAHQMVGAIVALMARPNLSLLPSQRATYIRFMVTNCAAKNEESLAYDEALHLLSSTVEGVENWLWPSLITALLDPLCSLSANSVLRALSPLAGKVIRDENINIVQKDFPSIKVLCRCLELLEDKKNRVAVLNFLRCASPLIGHMLKSKWDVKLQELMEILEEEVTSPVSIERSLKWEERLVEFLEESVQAEGENWSDNLAVELARKITAPHIGPLLGAVTDDVIHFNTLIAFSRLHTTNNSGEYSRAIGISAKRHLEIVLKLMEDSCNTEDSRKQPVKLLGLVKDVKATITAEHAKAGLLKCYAEIMRKGNPQVLFPEIERHILPWIIRQLHDCKEITAKEAGLIALEQVGKVVFTVSQPDSSGLKTKATALASLLALLQSPSGYRPLQLYSLILQAMISLLKIPPKLTQEEKEILISTMLDKMIATSSEIATMLSPKVTQSIITELGTVCGEIITDSADMLAEVVEILTPWMQSKSTAERKMTLIVLRYTLRSYHDSLKYTFPGGKLEPGKLLGRILSWSADPEPALRTLVIDCVILTLSIGARHRSILPDNNLNQDLNETKKIIVNEDPKLLYEGVKNLSVVACERIASGEIVSLAEGLIEGLLFRGEGGLAAGIALAELFKIRGAEIPRSSVSLIDNIINQMRLMENVSCLRNAAMTIKYLMKHHSQVVLEHLLHQPLPLDRGTQECWKELGTHEEFGLQTLGILLERLENNSVLSDSTSNSGKDGTAAFSSLAAIVALGYLLQSPNSEILIESQLAKVLGVLLKYLSGWIHVDAPVSITNTKFGFVPNRESSKLNPHREVYAVLVNVLTAVDSHTASGLLNNTEFDSAAEAEDNLVSIVHSVIRCLSDKTEVIMNLARSVEKLMTSTIPVQRAIATAFYAELVGKVNHDSIWLDGIINTLHEARADSSPLVRKLALIGLTHISYLKPKQIEEYFDNTMSALLEGLEEPSGASDVILESLNGLSVMLSIKIGRPVSPRIILTLKPFIEKENSKLRLAAVSALEAAVRNWQTTLDAVDDDITDQLLSCIPCLVIKLEDPNLAIIMFVREILCNCGKLLQCEPLVRAIDIHLGPNVSLNVEIFLREFIQCLRKELPKRAEELRNSVVRGYSRSEFTSTRATSALILGFFGRPTPEDVQRLLQLLRDNDSHVRSRAAQALALSFTL
ncbi:maestro heat-like repeat-containing protein family member 1 [Leptopilina heterotoma]|uniref:maestro heat-like repeat-containing protein family member 1 n=1 Tax=Leptopilina heterotoma TaxID=63436 RepID=UPI001CA87F26|nr:maestro heat-like repeat-containing protein family member 1 [Leptopilina heterotoma]